MKPRAKQASKPGMTYEQLRSQMPIIAFRDEQRGDDYIEPLPTHVGQWTKMSWGASLLGLVMISAAALLLLNGLNKSVGLQKELQKVPKITTKAQLEDYWLKDRFLKEKRIALKVENYAVVTGLEDVLQKAAQWEMRKNQTELTLILSLNTNIRPELVTQACDEKLLPLHWQFRKKGVRQEAASTLIIEYVKQ